MSADSTAAWLQPKHLSQAAAVVAVLLLLIICRLAEPEGCL
jgi:hypothetical protein